MCFLSLNSLEIQGKEEDDENKQDKFAFWIHGLDVFQTSETQTLSFQNENCLHSSHKDRLSQKHPVKQKHIFLKC